MCSPLHQMLVVLIGYLIPMSAIIYSLLHSMWQKKRLRKPINVQNGIQSSKATVIYNTDGDDEEDEEDALEEHYSKELQESEEKVGGW